MIGKILVGLLIVLLGLFVIVGMAVCAAFEQNGHPIFRKRDDHPIEVRSTNQTRKSK